MKYEMGLVLMKVSNEITWSWGEGGTTPFPGPVVVGRWYRHRPTTPDKGYKLGGFVYTR